MKFHWDQISDTQEFLVPIIEIEILLFTDDIILCQYRQGRRVVLQCLRIHWSRFIPANGSPISVEYFYKFATFNIFLWSKAVVRIAIKYGLTTIATYIGF